MNHDDRHVPTTHEGKLEPNYYCRAWNAKRQKYCKNRAGAGTNHPGEGRCKHHGGTSPIRHGRYSKITRPRIKELLDQYDNDPTPLDLLPEVKLLRALLTDFVERLDADDHTNVSAAATLADRVGAMVDRIEKHRKEGSITLETLDRVLEQLGVEVVHALTEEVPDATTRALILANVERRWGSIRLDPTAPTRPQASARSLN